MPALTALQRPTSSLATLHSRRTAEVGTCRATAQLARQCARLADDTDRLEAACSGSVQLKASRT